MSLYPCRVTPNRVHPVECCCDAPALPPVRETPPLTSFGREFAKGPLTSCGFRVMHSEARCGLKIGHDGACTARPQGETPDYGLTDEVIQEALCAYFGAPWPKWTAAMRAVLVPAITEALKAQKGSL